MSHCLHVWKSRDLTVQGKVLLIKANVHSAIAYELEARDIPNKYRDELTSIVNDFLWNGKRPLVSKTTITPDKNKGGLNIPTVEGICLASRVKMVYKIMHAKRSNWNCIGKHYLTLYYP